MKTSAEIRQANLDTLIAEAGGIPFLAARYDCTPAFLKALSARYKDSTSGAPKGIGDKVARRLTREEAITAIRVYLTQRRQPRRGTVVTITTVIGHDE